MPLAPHLVYATTMDILKALRGKLPGAFQAYDEMFLDDVKNMENDTLRGHSEVFRKKKSTLASRCVAADTLSRFLKFAIIQK